MGPVQSTPTDHNRVGPSPGGWAVVGCVVMLVSSGRPAPRPPKCGKWGGGAPLARKEFFLHVIVGFVVCVCVSGSSCHPHSPAHPPPGSVAGSTGFYGANPAMLLLFLRLQCCARGVERSSSHATVGPPPPSFSPVLLPSVLSHPVCCTYPVGAYICGACLERRGAPCYIVFERMQIG